VGFQLQISAFVSGIVAGTVYGLLALGIVVTYKSSKVLNFAAGAIGTFSAYCYYEAVEVRSLPMSAGLAAAVAAGAGLGAVCQFLIIWPTRWRSEFERGAATIGVMLLVQGGVAWVWGSVGVYAATPLPAGNWQLTNSIAVGKDQAAILAICCGVYLAIAFWYRRSLMGVASRATAENSSLAEVYGVRSRLVDLISWAAAGALAAVAGVLLMRLVVLTPFSLTVYLVPAFAAALFGGLAGIGRTLAGAILVGVGMSLATANVQGFRGIELTVPLVMTLGALSVAGERGKGPLDRIAELRGRRSKAARTTAEDLDSDSTTKRRRIEGFAGARK
jgi:branched-subunit amino acid ABC-type transport system permease component